MKDSARYQLCNQPYNQFALLFQVVNNLKTLKDPSLYTMIKHRSSRSIKLSCSMRDFRENVHTTTQKMTMRMKQ